MSVDLIFDNDALLKLTRYDLIDLALQVMDKSKQDVAVLPTAQYVLLPRKDRLRRCKSEVAASRLESMLLTSKKIDGNIAAPGHLDALLAIPNIDAGEAQILGVAASDKGVLVVTGDKRAIFALASAPEVGHIANELSGRIVSLEKIVLQMIEVDFSKVSAAIRANQDVDKAMTIVFGISAPASRETVICGLNSYIQAMRSDTGALLY